MLKNTKNKEKEKRKLNKMLNRIKNTNALKVISEIEMKIVWLIFKDKVIKNKIIFESQRQII